MCCYTSTFIISISIEERFKHDFKKRRRIGMSQLTTGDTQVELMPMVEWKTDET
jgi:hypothetical protein